MIHVHDLKFFFAYKENFVKGNVTSALEKPQIETLKKERKHGQRIKILSAVTSVPEEEPIKTVDTTVSENLADRQLPFTKMEKNNHGYS